MPPDQPASFVAPLPGAIELAAKMAKVIGDRDRIVLDLPGRSAAVLLSLFDRDQIPHVLLTKRTDTLTDHPGQVSLPGGRRDPNDSDLRMTALRETHEELGIAPEVVEVVGELDDVATYQSEFIVTPVVGLIRSAPDTRPNPGEIARVIEVSVADILAIDAELPETPSLRELRYRLDGEDVWGATARILRGFAVVAREALADAPA